MVTATKSLSIGRQVVACDIAAGLLHSHGIELSKVSPALRRNAAGFERNLIEQSTEAGYKLRGLGLAEYARLALQRENLAVPQNDEEVIRAAVTQSAFNEALDLVVESFVIQSYNEAVDSLAGWVDEVDVPNFKPQGRVSITLDPLEALPAGSVADEVYVGGEAESAFKIGRYAKRFSVDGQDLADDRMDIIIAAAKKMGQGAARIKHDLVYALLLSNPTLEDGLPLFHANHGNAGTDAFSSAAVKTGIAALAAQTVGDAGHALNLNLKAAFLVTSSLLRATAQEILHGQWIGQSDEDLQLRTDGRLSAGLINPYTGATLAGSATTWFMAADPSAAAGLELCYLSGTNRMPVVFQSVKSEGQWGLTWAVRMDAGCRVADHRPLYRGNI